MSHLRSSPRLLIKIVDFVTIYYSKVIQGAANVRYSMFISVFNLFLEQLEFGVPD